MVALAAAVPLGFSFRPYIRFHRPYTSEWRSRGTPELDNHAPAGSASSNIPHF